jgi:hypothetical protein
MSMGEEILREFTRWIDAMSGHEYRFAYSLFGIAGFTWGIIDALLADNYAAKYYISAIIFSIFFPWGIFEVYTCKTCKRNVREALNLVVYGVFGLHGIMGLTSMFIRFLLLDTGDLAIGEHLSPWTGLPVSASFIVALVMTFAYIYYGIRINLNNKLYTRNLSYKSG